MYAYTEIIDKNNKKQLVITVFQTTAEDYWRN